MCELVGQAISASAAADATANAQDENTDALGALTGTRHVSSAALSNPASDETGRDPLTGLLTPRAFFERLSAVRLESLADRRTCSLVIVDIDEFSDANQMFGYRFGDEILRHVASCLRQNFPDCSLLCRLGEDRFAVVLEGENEALSLARADALREYFSRSRLTWQDHPVSLTLSMGIAETGAGFAVTETELNGRAVQALREAKRSGRNRVVGFGKLAGASQGRWDLVNEQLGRAAEDAANINRQLRLGCLEGVGALVSAVEAKDPYTRRHSEQVAYYAEQFARQMGLAGDAVETIRVAAIMHDVGKIGIPDTVLTKAGKLTDEEYALIYQHPQMGANILLKISMLTAESKLVLHHHENWDGSGYPHRLAGERIPVGARLIQIADCIDAMLMRRVYKEPFAIPRVLDELSKGRSSRFDPKLADLAIHWLKANPAKVIVPKKNVEVA